VGRLCRSRGVLFHVDAAQKCGEAGLRRRARLHRPARPHGPQGARPEGCRRTLRPVRAARRPVPLLYGGGQERGCAQARCRRTRSRHGTGLRIAALEMADDCRAHRPAAPAALAGPRRAAGVELNGNACAGVAGHPQRPRSTASRARACCRVPALRSPRDRLRDGQRQPSYVLRALGRGDRLAQSSLAPEPRSLHDGGRDRDRDCAIQRAVGRLRAVAPSEARS